MAVLDPIRVVLENYPEDQVEEFDIANNPEDDAAGTRRVPFARELFIERDDFMEDPPKKFFRLAPGTRGAAARRLLRHLHRRRQGRSRRRSPSCAAPTIPRRAAVTPPDGRKVKATLHWVAAKTALDAEVRLYDRLFTSEQPARRGTTRADLNPLVARTSVPRKIEPSAAAAPPARASSSNALDTSASIPISAAGRLVFNRTVTLKDTWAKIAARAE